MFLSPENKLYIQSVIMTNGRIPCRVLLAMCLLCEGVKFVSHGLQVFCLFRFVVDDVF